jgi:hypothetical protein
MRCSQSDCWPGFCGETNAINDNQMMRPPISIALPVHNGANYLSEALDCALQQDFSDFELVVSDNCSTDETPAILEEYRRRDSRLRVHRSDVFLAQADNCTRAVDLCSGEWVKLFCHDDLMRKNCVALLRRTIVAAGDRVGLVGNGEAWLFGNGYLYDPNAGRPQEAETFKGTDFIKRALAGTVRVPLPSVTTATVRKAAWDACSKFDRRFVHFDVFLWTKLLMRWDYAFVAAPLTTNRIHGAQVAGSARKSLRSVSDARIFYPEFLVEFGAELDLSTKDSLRTRFRWAGMAGTTVAVELMKRNVKAAARVCADLPLECWPVLPMLVARSWWMERGKLSALAGRVPVSLIYPD